MEGYWQSLSIDWIEGGIPINENSLIKPEKIPTNKRYFQKLHHKVQKLLKKISKVN